MTTADERFHETWMGMVQPIEGLVVSMPVLLEADIVARKPPEVHERFASYLRKTKTGPVLGDVRAFAADMLELGAELRDDAVPKELSVHLAEGRETIRPTWALRRESANATASEKWPDRYQLLAWELPADVDLDRPDARAGSWAYPPRAKFERLLRHAGVPIGLVSNGRVLRLVYAPPGESTGSITFRVADMASVDGRPILDALLMLLHARRFDAAGAGRSLAELFAASRKRQAEVSKELEGQVRAALERLLRGFEEAEERDGTTLVSEAQAEGTLTHGLLTLLLRIVFVLFAEDRELLPMDHALYREGMSVLGLFERLQADAASHPDSMSRRFGAYGRLVALFRCIFLGVEHGDFRMPPRHGDLFDPHRFPFLEGWGPAGGAPITLPEERAGVRVPSVDDSCIFDVLRALLYLRRERLSYRALDVEQIGSVYEGLIAYGAMRVASPAVRLGDGVWIEMSELLAQKPSARAKWLEDKTDLVVGKCKTIAEAVAGAKDEDAAAAALGAVVKDAKDHAGAGRLVLQPGPDRKHTSSHYTPRSLSEPIVERTLRPLLAAMGDAPSSERILSLKVCDPAMGSGAFLVAACRFLGGQVVAAWTREGRIAEIAAEHADVVTHARRLVAQRCLYGVDKNPFAVSLGKLSLWLATLAKGEPFTFIDHALRCGDSLVGLSFEQIEKFTWEPITRAEPKMGQLELGLFSDEIAFALKEALTARQRIEALADDGSKAAMRERERHLDDATDALERVRLIADLVVGAFFAHEKPKDREVERARREERVRAWLRAGGPAPAELRALADDTRRTLRPLHWPVEFPEIFFAERPDPLEDGALNRVAMMDAFVGNPPFAGKNAVVAFGDGYLDWLLAIHEGAHGNADLSAHFFRRMARLLGAHGTMGLIATNTISQGDTRSTGLQHLVTKEGFVIYDAVRSMTWSGQAAVAVSLVHLAKGSPLSRQGERRLDGVAVPEINSRLRGAAERGDPIALAVNVGRTFTGVRISGAGFVLTPDERERILAEDPRCCTVIAPFLGGEEANTDPTQEPHRFVINFGRRSLEEASGWPTLLARVEQLVKPLRDAVRENVGKGGHGKKYWWQFVDRCDPLYDALAGCSRCLVAANVSKHFVLSWQPTNTIFANSLCVFALDRDSAFALLQSRVHEPWARLHSSSLETRLRYTPTDCFDTFPFPDAGRLTALDEPGRAFYEARAAYMKDENVGLTITYNRLKDSNVTDARMEHLRALTVAMDRAVLAAYSWDDLEPPAFTTPKTDEEHARVALFEDAVVDRLFALNAERAKTQGSAVRQAAVPDDGDEDAADTIAKSGRTAKAKSKTKGRKTG